MTHKFNPKNKQRLHSSARRRKLPPLKILKAIGIQPGQKIADIGCGSGYFTFPLAELTGKTGRVFAVDIQEQMLEAVGKNLKTDSNIEVVKSGEYTFRLPAAFFDVVFCAFVLHEVRKKNFFIKRLKELLKPKGKIAVIDWQAKQTKSGPPIAHRVKKEDVIYYLYKNGFKEIEEINIGRDFYCLAAEKGGGR